MSSFHTEETVFNLVVGEDYEVFGLGLYSSVLLALVLDTTAKPNWLPADLFEFRSTRLAARWQFSLFSSAASFGQPLTDGWIALWGYPALVQDAGHSNGLVERDPSALEIFFREVAYERGSEAV